MTTKAKLDFIDVNAGNTAYPALSQAPISYATPVDNDQVEEGLLGSTVSTFRRAGHPVAALFHVLFKALAILLYLFGNWFSSNFIFIFVLCIIALAFDFWTVKNVTGRLLVGLRWWNRINEDGSNEWIFESLEDLANVDPIDSKIFWTVLYGTPVVWGVFFISTLLSFRFTWMIIVIAALLLSGANIVGYTKCRKDAKEKMQAFMQAGAFSALKNAGGQNLFSSLGSLAMGAMSGGNGKPQRSDLAVV